VSGHSEHTAASFKSYLEICLEDAQLAAVAHGYSLNERSLHKIYIRLLDVGMDEWIRGQHAALASIGSAETLLYVVRSRQRKRDWNAIATGLRRYLYRQVAPQELLATA